MSRAFVKEPDGDQAEPDRPGTCLERLDEPSKPHRFCIVGEDELEVAAGHISWNPPLGRAVMGKALGAACVWDRPAGDLEIEIASMTCPS